VSGIAQEQSSSTPLSGILNASFTENIDALGDVTFAQIQDDNRTVTFDTVNGNVTINQVYQDPGFLFAQDYGTTPGYRAMALAANPYAQGWNYQSFGVWVTDTGNPGASDYSKGAMSVGAVTPASAIPAAGTAAFNGQIGYTDGAQTWAAGLTVNVDFGARTASLSSGSFHSADFTSPIGTNDTITGSLSYQAGQNALSGTVAGHGVTLNGLTGTATARFYGPAAQEIGGVFNMGPNIGAFGAKR
jgi:hypothetical protein